ncbi:hypothetical protein [Williamsia sterculiae]|uniref:Transmembrane protein n=1 Tax=Williamsia sterculiae TaxID=1344003 RepID=A0A1N7DM03_9NOCA|nr:hypothetical protein [Williamsia sterculiae]SIR76758.1 hypothetical protein SAMN05445060_0743 [Williamsia sterculiae]
MTIRAIRLLLVLGALPIGWYGVSLIWEMNTIDKTSIGIWLIGGLIAHDAIFAPLCIAAGFGARRFLPQRWWPPVLAASAATLLLVLLAGPVLWPRSAATAAPGNNESATLLDRPYGLALAIAVLVIWALVVVTIARGRRSR